MSEKVENINPYSTGGAKHNQVRRMFDNIAPAYDNMNALMSLGMHRRWRDITVAAIAETSPHDILDIATGTGDIAIALARALPDTLVTGVDLSPGMVEVGRSKVEVAGLAERVNLRTADALDLPFDDNSFDAVTVAYGVRNFEHLDRGYAEMRRVLRSGGILAVLELTRPSSALLMPFYKAYTSVIIPAVGGIVSHDTAAYRYLPRSIAAVPAREDMCRLMHDAGFVEARYRSLDFGVCTLYLARK